MDSSTSTRDEGLRGTRLRPSRRRPTTTPDHLYLRALVPQGRLRWSCDICHPADRAPPLVVVARQTNRPYRLMRSIRHLQLRTHGGISSPYLILFHIYYRHILYGTPCTNLNLHMRTCAGADTSIIGIWGIPAVSLNSLRAAPFTGTRPSAMQAECYVRVSLDVPLT